MHVWGQSGLFPRPCAGYRADVTCAVFLSSSRGGYGADTITVLAPTTQAGLDLSSQSLGDICKPVCRHTRTILGQQASENDPRANGYPYSLWACLRHGNVGRPQLG
jgi:hypothetical protein